MSSTSQKHKDFVAEPMGEKPVMALAGIGEVLGKRLEDKGFDKVTRWNYTVKKKIHVSWPHGQGTSISLHWFQFLFIIYLQAYVVLGQFLVLKKDEELFRDWLKDTCGANVKQQGDCFGCLKEWCDAFL